MINGASELENDPGVNIGLGNADIGSFVFKYCFQIIADIIEF